jgi:hypothetical protein
MTDRRRRSLLLLALVCFIPLPPVFLAWLVNVELAIRAFAPGWSCLQALMPRLFAALAAFGADLSTVSTGVPVLMLAYPLAQALRVARRLDTDPGFAHRLEADPYPPHFGFFLVMLGLTGTLHGMLIGLDVSGVEGFAASAPSASAIRGSLDRLLAGTATALLSSLVGLIGAFLAAKPIPWLFRRIAGIEADESKRTITETVERLTEDLRGLSQASRVFAARLRPESLGGLLDRLDRQEASFQGLLQEVRRVGGVLEGMRAEQERTNARLESVERLGAAAQASVRLGEAANALLDRLAGLQEKGNELTAALNAENERRHHESRAALQTAADAARENLTTLRKSQESLRKALAAYGAGE